MLLAVIALAAAGPWHAPLDPAALALASGPGLAGAIVSDLLQQDERLWVATAGGGLGQWDGQRWRHWQVAQGLPSDQLSALRLDGDALWLDSPEGAARVSPDGSVTRLPAGAFSQALEQSPARLSCCGLLLSASGRPITIHQVLPQPDGAWLATDAGLRWWDGQVSELIFAPPGGRVLQIARAGQDLFLAGAEGGLWQLHGDQRRHYGRAEGLPSEVVYAVASGPAGKLWLGTDRGVALLDPNGSASPLPLAPLAAGLPTLDVVATRAGLAVASQDGLVWVGHGAPRGWNALAVAVPQPRGLRQIERDWWSWDATSAVRLHRGQLSRWAPAAPLVEVLPDPAGAILVSRAGPQWWMPGAKVLSAVGPLPDVVAGDSLGTLRWFATTRSVVREGPGVDHSFSQLGVPRDLAADPAGAWVVSDLGLFRLTGASGVDPVPGSWSDLRQVSVYHQQVWVSDGAQVWGPNGALELGDIGAIYTLHADAAGLWVASEAGLFRR